MSQPAEDPPLPLQPGERILRLLLFGVPKNALSRMAGRLAGWRPPAFIRRPLLRAFVRFAGVDLDEAERPLDDYASLQALFTRTLKKGVRPIAGDERDLVAPCDGAWGASGAIDGGTLVQVKGRSYRVRDLLGDVDHADAYEGGAFATFYLSPRDYHRFHTPAAGVIRQLDYWPGALWPVNRIGLHGVEALFAKNERICAYLEPDGVAEPDAAVEVIGGAAGEVGRSAIALVAVGATMVGSVRLSFSDLTTNRSGARAERRVLGQNAPHLERGQEWGWFEFGSTIVMLLPPDAFELHAQPEGTPLRMGAVIGRQRGT